LLGDENVSQDEADLADYGVDKYSFHGGPRLGSLELSAWLVSLGVTLLLFAGSALFFSPNIVVFPNSVEDVSGIAKICSKYKLPVKRLGLLLLVAR
jgi:FAD/FMN-containing dehydrogenase